MYPFPKPSVLLPLLTILSFLFVSHAIAQAQQPEPGQSFVSEWSSLHTEHVLGLPGAKAKETGTLRITANDLSFMGKTSRSVIGLQSVFAVGAGNERVEFWGIKGRILRMAMPNGSGLFAATFMHHRVDMLTVEFGDQNGAYHAAVFFLPANEATRAAQIIATTSVSHRGPANNSCSDGQVQSAAVRVPVPSWDDASIPAAYRALLYEHLIEGLRATAGVKRVYRDGEVDAESGCPQFTVEMSVTGFRPGNQVVRASTGPVGFFVGTTQMVSDIKITQAGGQSIFRDQIKATVRGESESTKVAESVAKKVVKEYAASEKQIVGSASLRTAAATAYR